MLARYGRMPPMVQPRRYRTSCATPAAFAQLVAAIALIVSIVVAGAAVTMDIAGAQALQIQDAGYQGLTSSHDADFSLIAALLIAAVVTMGLLSTFAVRLVVRGRGPGLTKS